MIPFFADDPYPQLPEAARNYADEQIHAARVDDWLGIRTDAIETRLRQSFLPKPGEERWIGLPTQALLTPYTELRRTLDLLAPKPGQRIVDLGAGYGRLGFVLHRHYPETEFIGYEIVPERVIEGQRALQVRGCIRAWMEEVDLSHPEFRPEAADFYFIYDFGARHAIAKAMTDLRAIAATRPIAVVGRGRASRDAIEREHPWLSGVVPPEHHGRFTIYRSR